MALRDEQHHHSPRDVPPVGRPRGAVWRSLQADGVVWEGQVLLVGDDVDLAARMIVTHRRVAFVRGGDVILEIPRVWMRQEPVLRRDGVLDLFVAAPGSGVFDEPTTVPLRMREGHPAAGHIIAMLAPGGARRIDPDALSGMERARETAPEPVFGGFWDDLPDAAGERRDDAAPAARGTDETRARAGDGSGWLPPEPIDRVIRVPSAPPRPAGSGYSIAGIAPRDQRRSPWALFLRLGALLLLLAVAAAIGAGRVELPFAGRPSEAVLTAPSPPPPTAVTAETPAAAAMTPEEMTASALGVGGGDDSVETASALDTAAQTATEPPATAPAATTAAPAATPATPAAAPPAAATPPVAETAAPPAPATAAASPEQTAGTPADAATPGGVVAAQPAAVAADEAPAQEIVVGPLRVAFPTALRAETLPRYGLPPGSGEWVLLVAEITNQGDAGASLAMPELRLFDRASGQVYDLDTGVDVIASLAGFDPAWTAGDLIEIAPGATAEALLLYLLPPGSSDDLALIVGQSSLDVAPLLALGEADAAARPELAAGTVAEVLDGDTIVVDLGGVRQEVQYLGMAAPAAGACFAAEAAAANAQLLVGQQVWLERQASDTAAGVLLRDVWIAAPDGAPALVAARLLEAGAGTANPAPPDTRYQAWLAASEALGRSNGAGLWGACPGA
jgi:endonuclease YncB( thermonuclease family)